MLLEQFEVEQLLLDLEHVEGFLLDIVMVPTATVARQLITLAIEEMTVRRGESVTARAVAPDPGKAKPLDPVTARELVDDVLRPLLVAPPSTSGFSFTWLDASTAREIDRDAWAHLFARFNERRDAIIEALGEPLLIVVPPFLEATLAHNAPDTWSARTGIYRVKLAALESHELDILAPHAAKSTPPRGKLVVTFGLHGEIPLALTNDARAQLLGASARHLIDRGADDEAIAAAKRAVEHAERALSEAPDSLPAIATLSGALDVLSSALSLVGSSSDRGACTKRWLDLAQRWAELAPDDLAARRALAFAHRNSAIEGGGDAIKHAHAAIAEARTAYDSDHSRASATVLADCLAIEAEFCLQRGALDAANASIEEARRLLGIHDAFQQSTTSIVLLSLASDVDADRGEFYRALSLGLETLSVAERLFDRRPREVENAYSVIVAAVVVVRRYAALGDAARVIATCRRALRKADGPIQRYSFAGKLIEWVLGLYVAMLDHAGDVVALDEQKRWLEQAERLASNIATERSGSQSFEIARLKLVEHRARLVDRRTLDPL